MKGTGDLKGVEVRLFGGVGNASTVVAGYQGMTIYQKNEQESREDLTPF